MKATISIASTEIITSSTQAILNADGPADTLKASDIPARSGNKGSRQAKPESELWAAARRKGLNLKELAKLMDVSCRCLSQVANGHWPWIPMMRERALAVLGEVPGQGVVYRRTAWLRVGRAPTYGKKPGSGA